MNSRAYLTALAGVLALAFGALPACGGVADDDDASSPGDGGRNGSGGRGGGAGSGAGGSGTGGSGGAGGFAGGANAVSQIAAGPYYTCALALDGTVRCWGRGTAELGYGRGVGAEWSVGDDEAVSLAGPVLVGGFVSQISAGGSSCALLDGSVRCWGSNSYGELGNDNINPVGDDETPGTVEALTFASKASQIATGASHTCALLEDGSVHCWGAGTTGCLGYPGVASLKAPSADAIDLGGKATQIALGENHSCALIEGGTVRCWGGGAFGQLGLGNKSSVGVDEAPSAVGAVELGGVVAEIGVGGNHTCARLEDGTVRCWGANGSGQLGLGNKADIGDDELPSSVGAVDLRGEKALQLALGSNHTCVLIEGGTARCWGSNDKGQLGLGHSNVIGDNESPSANSVPVEVGGVVKQIAAGLDHTCALLEGGTVRCWGGNEFGQLGYGNRDNVGDSESPSSVGAVPLF